MDIRTAAAALGYSQSAKPDAARPDPGPVADFTRSMTQTLSANEDTVKAAMTGDASPQALVQALAETQLAVETAVTVRDRVVEAYQEILRMPV